MLAGLQRAAPLEDLLLPQAAVQVPLVLVAGAPELGHRVLCVAGVQCQYLLRPAACDVRCIESGKHQGTGRSGYLLAVLVLDQVERRVHARMRHGLLLARGREHAEHFAALASLPPDK